MGSLDSRSTQAPTLPGGAVMVVDDDPESLQLMEKALGRGGYEVRSFSGGRIALAAAVERPPDLILLDIKMPEMNGYEVCERLKLSARLAQIPVIFVSGLCSTEEKLQGFRLGGVDYVSKPFQSEEVQARVESHLEQRRFQRQVEADNCRLHDLVEAQLTRVADAQFEAVFAIAKVADARDDITGRHQNRVQNFCKLLAVGLGEQPKYQEVVNYEWINNIFHASPLHDIGKVSIPDRILLKPGPLDFEEFEIMKTHTTLGSKILSAVHERYPDNPFIGMGIEVARSHHERWDGAGYPDGLGGVEIPLCARILAVADCYDTLRSRRCYKSPVSHDDTYAIIMSESGRHFEPQITVTFRALQGTFQDVWSKLETDSDTDSGRTAVVPPNALVLCEAPAHGWCADS
jgi:putative two-component system response regulator